MMNFYLERTEDATGVSEVGTVAEGVVFSNGWVALTWLTEHTSVAFYPSIAEVEAIHGHQGRTKVVYLASAASAASAWPLTDRLADLPDRDRREGP